MAKRTVKPVEAKPPAQQVPPATNPAEDAVLASVSDLPLPDLAGRSLEPAWAGKALAIALGLWLAAFALPVGGDQAGGMAWLALAGKSGGHFAAVHTLAVWLAVAAAAAVGMAFGRPAWLVAGAVLTQLALHVRLDAEPALWQAVAEPLRSSLYGMQPAGFVALLAAGMGAGLTGARSSHWRWVAGLGALGLFLHDWLPVGWIGAVRLPVLAALVGVPEPFEGTAKPGTLQLAHGTWLFLQGLASASLLGVLAFARQPKPATWLALLALAAFALVGHAASAGVALTLVVLTGTALSAAALLIALHRSASLEEWRPGWEPLAVAAIVGLYLILKTAGLGYSTTDESLYYYAGKVWAEGKWPYRDYFFSHPPLHVAPLALLYKLFGYHFVLGKWLSAFESLMACLAVWRIGRHVSGPAAGVVALGMALLATETLQSSTNLTGVTGTSMWLWWGVWAAIVARKPFVSGALMGAAASTGFYSIAAALAIMLLHALQPWKGVSPQRHAFVRSAAGFFAIWGGLALICYAMGGDQYVKGVYAYHFAKKAKLEGFTPMTENPFGVLPNFFLMLKAKDFLAFFYYHAAHLWLGFLLPVLMLVRKYVADRRQADGDVALGPILDPRRWWTDGPPVLLAWAVSLALLLEFAQFKERYDFYYAMFVPGLAVLSATALADMGRLWRAVIEDGKDSARLAAVVTGLIFLAWVPINLQVDRAAFPSEFKRSKDTQGAGERLKYDWFANPAPEAFSQLTQAFAWKGWRVRGSLETGINHYLWNKKRWFSQAEAIADYIKANAKPGETMTGASDYAPLIALLSGMKMSGDHVDTNSKVFTTGTIPVSQFWDEACADGLTWVIIAPRSYFTDKDFARRPTSKDQFALDKAFVDDKLRHWKTETIEVWKRKTDGPCKYLGRRDVPPEKQG